MPGGVSRIGRREDADLRKITRPTGAPTAPATGWKPLSDQGRSAGWSAATEASAPISTLRRRLLKLRLEYRHRRRPLLERAEDLEDVLGQVQSNCRNVHRVAPLFADDDICTVAHRDAGGSRSHPTHPLLGRHRSMCLWRSSCCVCVQHDGVASGLGSKGSSRLSRSMSAFRFGADF